MSTVVDASSNDTCGATCSNSLVPHRVDGLVAGKRYLWCTCGRSSKQPFCDNLAHKGTAHLPLIFVAEPVPAVALCGCKKTCKPPYCDGAHMHLDPPA